MVRLPGDAAVPAGSVASAEVGSQDVAWIRQFGTIGPVGDRINGLAVDAAGNVYVVGATDGTLPGQTRSGSTDAFARKYDASGNVVWTRQFGTTGFDTAVEVTTDSSAVFVLGYVNGALPGQTRSGGNDVFVRKYDPDGNEVWTRQFGTPTVEYPADIAMDGSSVYVMGSTYGSLPGFTNTGDYDIFVRKYDFGGSELWTRQFGADWRPYPQEIGLGISVLNGGVYLVGRTFGAFPGFTNLGSFDAFVRKYDANGNAEWTRQFGTGTYEEARKIVATSIGVYVLGSTWGALPGQTNLGGKDEFLREYDFQGNEQWTRQFGTPEWDGAGDYFVPGAGGQDVGGGALLADAGGLYVSGQTRGALSAVPNAGRLDAYVRVFDFSGNEQWTIQFGTPGDDGTAGMALYDGSVVVGGTTTGVLPGQVGLAGSPDAYLRVYDAAGSEAWSRQFGTVAPQSDFVNAADAAGNLYVAGATTGILPNQALVGSQDVFVQKYDVAGNVAWTRQFGSAGGDGVVAILVDASGLYVIGNAGEALPGQTFGGWRDVFVRRYDLDGNEVWTRQFGNDQGHSIGAVAADSSGVYVAGTTWLAFPGEVKTSPWEDVFVRRYDPHGNERWTHQFGASGVWFSSAFSRGVALDGSGVYVAGSATGAIPGNTWAGSSDAYVRKYDADGNEVWTRQFGTAGSDGASAIFVDASGVRVAGTVGNALPGQTWAGSSDIFVRTYDPDGNEGWTRQFGSPAPEFVSSFAVDASGLYVAGATLGALPGQTRAGGQDVFLRKYAPDGTESWTRQFGSAAFDSVVRIEVDFTGVYVAGSTSGALPGQTRAGLADAYVRKYDHSGSELWTRQIGTAAAETVFTIATDFTDVYLVGATRGAFPGFASDGSADALVLKIAFTSRQKISLCAGLVEDLVSAGVLTKGQANSLVVKLAAADAQLERGNTIPAMNILHAFINEVNALAQSGRLSSTQGALLAGFAGNVIEQIRSGG